MGSISKLRQWWDRINDLGQYYGYHPNAVKSTLLVKSHLFEEASEQFNNTNVSVTCDGVNVLGCPLGSDVFVKRELDRKVKVWCERVRILQCLSLRLPTVLLHMECKVSGHTYFAPAYLMMIGFVP